MPDAKPNANCCHLEPVSSNDQPSARALCGSTNNMHCIQKANTRIDLFVFMLSANCGKRFVLSHGETNAIEGGSYLSLLAALIAMVAMGSI